MPKASPMSRFTTKTIAAALPALVLLGLSVAIPTTANAQEIQLTGPLKGAPAVRRLKLFREGRIEIAPSATFTLLDEYRRHIILGARINYGITDWLAIGVWGGAGIGFSTDLTSQIEANSPRTGLTVANLPGGTDANGKKYTGKFANQVAQIQYVAMGQVTAIPFRGKFSLFQAFFSDIDAYVFAGAGVVGTKERAACTDFASCAAQGAKNGDRGDRPMEGKSRFAPTWGLGFNFYINNFLSLGVEWRMLPFAWNRSGFDGRGLDEQNKESTSGRFPDGRVNESDATFQLNQMLGVSLGFSLPLEPKITD